MHKVHRIVSGLLVSALVLSGCSGTKNLEQENAALAGQVQSLSAQVEQLGSSVLVSWSLTPSPDDAAGTDIPVLLRAEPAAYLPEKTVELAVTLGGSVVQQLPCLWDGTAYTAYLSLLPTDGYGYYLLLSDADGQTAQLCLSAPEFPAAPSATNLGTTFAPSSAQLVIEDWEAAEHVLTIRQGVGEIHMPLLGPDGQSVSCTGAQLMLTKGGVSLGTTSVPLLPGEVQGSCYARIEDVSFTLPVLGPEEQLDLWLTAFLSTGEALTSQQVSWYPSGDALELAVG